MTFHLPLILLMLIPLAAAIIFLYLLKMKRKEKLVSSIMLWQDAAADIEANAPFQKLKKNLLLFLQLLALLMLALSLAQPYVKAKKVSNSKTIVIIDSSASMKSTDIQPSRFEYAKSQAIKIANGITHGNTMLVITAGDKARVEAAFTSDRKKLAEIISSLKATDTRCDMRQAIALALSLVSGKSAAPPNIIVMSDGGFDSLTDLQVSQAKLDFVCIGKSSNNAAITGMAARKAFSGKQQVYIGIKNYSDAKQSFNLELYINDKLYDIREISLQAGSSCQEMINDVGGVSGRVTAKIDAKDDLISDNSAYVYMTGKRELSALLISPGNVFLQNALNMDTGINLARTTSIPPDLQKLDYDLVVFDRVSPPEKLPVGGYLLIDSYLKDGPASIDKAVANPQIIDVSKNHPVNVYVQYSGIKIAKANTLKMNEWGVPIIESNQGVIGAAGIKDGRRIVQLSWNLLESDFPLRTGFPIFIANCIDWVIPVRNILGESIKTGSAIYINVPSDTSSLTITDPSGNKQDFAVNQNPAVFDGTNQAGIYKISGNAGIKEFACNILSSQESNTKPNKSIAIGTANIKSGGKQAYANHEFYGLLIAAALLILSIEWYVYHRRI